MFQLKNICIPKRDILESIIDSGEEKHELIHTDWDVRFKINKNKLSLNYT